MTFLDNKPEMNGFARHLISSQSKGAQSLPPDLEHFKRALIQAGFEGASRIYAEMSKVTPQFSLKEEDLDKWGRDLVARGRIKEAIEVFKLNVGLHPESSGVFLRLAMAYLNDGNRDLAM